jgi:Fibronectin type III domain
MCTQRLSRFLVGITVPALFVMFFLNESVSSAARDKTSPTTPTNLMVTAITETTITLSWNAASDNSGKFSYRLKINNLNNSVYNSLATISQSQTSYTARYLAMNSSYSFAIYAVDDSGNRSGDSNTASAKTLADATPPATPVLQAAAIAPSQVQLTWTKSTDNVANNCCNYTFKVNGSTITQNINWAAAPADKLSVIIRHLTPGTNYSFNVSVSDWSGGNTATSNTALASTPPSSDTTPPSVPTNLHLVQDNSCGEVWLGWNEATDETDPQSRIEYEIYVDDVLSPLPVSAGIDLDFVYATAFGDNVFYVRAVDLSGNSSAPSKAIKLFLWPC